MKNEHVTPALVILAAGMGSRYGGLKQIDTVGNNGESIIDFTIYDAIEAGFKKVYLIIQKQHEAAFDRELKDKIKDHITVEYIYQDILDVPADFEIPKNRKKPWGTTHALLAGRKQISEPFIILNADDYYGKDAFVQMHEYLTSTIKQDEYALMGYQLVNTLSDSGSVTRAICEVDSGYLKEINEVENIVRDNGGAKYTDAVGKKHSLSADTLASMNFWAFTPNIIPLLTSVFEDFLHNEVKKNPETAEALLPNDIGYLMKTKGIKLKVFNSSDAWFGVTYLEDKAKVVKQFEQMKADGLYPFDLWK